MLSMAGGKETASEKEEDKSALQKEDETSSESGVELQMDDYEEDREEDDEDVVEAVIPEKGSAAMSLNCAVISVLFETPSGFAIFGYDEAKLTQPEAWKHIWADFVNVPKAIVWLKAFQPFEDKAHAINASAVSPELTMMIQKYVVNGQKLAVGKMHYKNVIQSRLGIPCRYDRPITELMWGLTIQMRRLVPEEKSEVTNEDRFPMSEGMGFFLNYHKFHVNLNMMVTKRIIELAGIMYDCNRCVDKYNDCLRFAAKHLTKISQIDTSGWDLLKLATAFKMICYPSEEIPAAKQLFRKQHLKRFKKDAPRYEKKILKTPCLEIYKEMYSARKTRLDAAKVLVPLVMRAKKAYEDEQADRAAIDHEIGPDRKNCHGISPVVTDELAEWHTLSAELKERQVPPTLAPVDAFERYTHISSYPLSMMNRPGILSVDIHPSKDIVATGGIDTNIVLLDRASGHILCTLTGHSKKITSLKFVDRNELFITGSADKTVRIWQGRNDENYSCIHTLKDHTAEVEAVTVHVSQKYFVTASRDNSWRSYDISTGSCLTQVVGQASGQDGYTSAAFHPDGIILGTGTTGAVVEIWDVKTQSKVTNIGRHVGPVTSMSFSENGYLLATSAVDGVKLWDLRKYKNFMTLSPYNLDTPTNAVEFDFSGRYLAIGGSDIRVYKVASDFLDYNVIKTLPDPSGTGKITSMKFGADSTYIAVGSMDENLRIFGLQSYQPATRY